MLLRPPSRLGRGYFNLGPSFGVSSRRLEIRYLRRLASSSSSPLPLALQSNTTLVRRVECLSLLGIRHDFGGE